MLSVDIGTSSLKAALIDTEGSLRAFSRISYKSGSQPAISSDWEEAFIIAMEKLYAATAENFIAYGLAHVYVKNSVVTANSPEILRQHS